MEAAPLLPISNFEMGKLDDILYRYLELSAQYAHCPRRPHDRPLYDEAQRELWALAQAICQLTNPKIQIELDAARRDVMAQVRLHIENVGPVVVRPARKPRPMGWAEFQLTPELATDLTITGATVTLDVAKRLREAHKQQVSRVYTVVHSSRKDFKC